MDRAGALEVLMRPCSRPRFGREERPLCHRAGRAFQAARPPGRNGSLGPTHEEVITTLVAGEIGSYRQLPQKFYRIQTKFRDELRPRFGLMRAKVIMKDAYSFDATDELAQVSYQRMYNAYARIFRRCGLKAIAVEADTGVMGGKFSHEFMVRRNRGKRGGALRGMSLCGQPG